MTAVQAAFPGSDNRDSRCPTCGGSLCTVSVAAKSPTFWVPGLPQPQGSAKAFVVNGRARITSDNPKMRSWRVDVKAVAEKHFATTHLGPVSVMALFCFPRPAGHFGTGRNSGMVKPSAPRAMAVKPDLDKLIRALLDALTGIAYRDDAQVIGIASSKVYCADGMRPGVQVTVTPGDSADMLRRRVTGSAL